MKYWRGGISHTGSDKAPLSEGGAGEASGLRGPLWPEQGGQGVSMWGRSLDFIQMQREAPVRAVGGGWLQAGWVTILDFWTLILAAGCWLRSIE